MCLTRADLECGSMRELLRSTALADRVLSDADLDRSRRALLDGRIGDVWVFAYGSLIWNPLFAHVEQRPAQVHGYHREFCLRSVIGRGTPECPGLVLGLDRGGSCRGIAYRLPAAEVDADLRLLWRREMVIGSYRPRWLRARIADAEIETIAFVVDRGHPHYACRLSEAQIATTLRHARGRWGSSREYFEQTLECLRERGIIDGHLERVARALAG